MSRSRSYPTSSGPFTADQIRNGDPYELSDGHAILCMPTGGRGAAAAATGAAVLRSDPAVQSAGVETGFALSPNTLRAPDVAVGNVPDEPGWVKGVPPLAVEYADTGQDEADLKVKISELLAAGTQYIWVVRLTGPRRVEVHERGKKMRLVHPGDELSAPGVLKNSFRVEALYDWEVGQEVTLKNLLQRYGYADLEAVRHEGAALGRVEGELTAVRATLLEVFETRDLQVGVAGQEAIAACSDLATLRSWHRQAITVATAAEIWPD